MKPIKYVAIAALAYVGLVVVFETWLGVAQPRFEETVVITTTGEDGSTEKRVVTPMINDGKLYVSANHWPRSWYNRVLQNPQVQVTREDETKDYVAVPIAAGSEEHERLQRDHPHPALFRFVTGYPPRRFVRFDPR